MKSKVEQDQISKIYTKSVCLLLSTIVELKNVNKKAWEKALRSAGTEGTLFQSSYWADYLKTVYKDQPIFIASLNRKGDIQALLLAIESCYAKHPTFNATTKRHILFSHLYKNALLPIFQKMLPYIVWENGPIILPNFRDKPEKVAMYRDIIQKIIQKAKEERCYSLAFVRPAFFSDQPSLLSSLDFEKKRMGTILVNLKQPLDVLRKQVDRKDRNKFEKTEKRMQIERVRNKADLRLLYYMHLENQRRSNRTIRPFSLYSSLWDYFSPKDKIEGFVAYYDGRLVGSILYLNHNLKAHLYALGDSDFARLNRVPVLGALFWHTIKYTRERAFEYLDLSGIELHKIDAGESKALGIFRFKSKFGGQLVEYHDYRKTLRSSKTVNILNCFLSEGEGRHN